MTNLNVLEQPSRRAFLRSLITAGSAEIESESRSAPPLSPQRTRSTTDAASLAFYRLGHGPRLNDVAWFQTLGSNDTERLDNYIDLQLAPANIPDPIADSRMAEAGFDSLNMTDRQLWENFLRNGANDYKQPGKEVERAKFIRATYSERQLFEVIVDFWHDHFSVYAWNSPIESVFPSYDRVMRTHALGNFRELLGGVAKSPAMLYYLDNVYSMKEGPNENYARELLELHTLGVNNYFGGTSPDQVQGYPNSQGYVENDVYELARALTGWSVRYQSWDPSVGDTGEFFTNDNWHDMGQKQILGQIFPAGQGAVADGEQALDLLARHPATANFVCEKLVRRFVNDMPPVGLVNSAANLFMQLADAPDQLKQVLRHILFSAEFRNSANNKIKRPFAAVVGALRSVSSTFVPRVDDWDSDLFLWHYASTGHRAFGWEPPNGYPDMGGFWLNSSTVVMRWRILNWLTMFQNSSQQFYCDVVAQTPSHLRTPTAVVDYWIGRIYTQPPAGQEYLGLIDFMNNAGFNNHAVDIQNDTNDQNRLRALVALMWMSPAYQTC